MEQYPVDYHTLTQFLSELRGHEGVEVSVLTRSILGREIPLITLGKGKHAALYVGAHHGMEGITCGVLLDFIADYIKQYEKKATVYDYSMQYLFEQRRIYIVPMLNPDGVEYAVHGVEDSNPLLERVIKMNNGKDFSNWQANARGVDLNHNYDMGFLAYKKKEAEAGIMGGAPTRYSGEYPESEPETAALCRFLRFQRHEIKGVLTLHTQGEEIFCSCEDNLTAKTMSVGRVISRFTGYRLARPEGLAAFGGLTDWCIASLCRPAFTLECGKGKNPLPPTQRPLIYERLRRTLFSFPCLV